MKRIGIIVDGPGDLKSLKTKYDGKFKILKTDGPRGHCAPVDKIISNSKKQIKMLQALKCNKVIIMLDFECRLCNYDEFINQLFEQVKIQELSDIVSFVVPNKMIENWYLADIEYLSSKKKYLKDSIKQKKYEGLHGKDEIKKLMKNNFTYSETEHGPELFTLIREDIACKNSFSFNMFYELINEK